MPTIKEILQEERSCGSGCLVLFLEGKFWKAYERSAYVLTMLYNFKPSKRFIKLVGEEVISVGFPYEQFRNIWPGLLWRMEENVAGLMCTHPARQQATLAEEIRIALRADGDGGEKPERLEKLSSD